MDHEFQTNLKKYAEIAIKVGLNIQPGQKLILQAIKRGGVSLQTAPVVRELAAAAYQAGAKLVDVLWKDETIRLLQFELAPRDSFHEYPAWQAQGVLDVIEDGGAVLTISAFDPSLLEGQDSELIAQQQGAIQKLTKPISDHVGKNTMNWTVLSIPVTGWADKVFPDLPEEEQIPALWDALFKICRVYEDDPVGVWQTHLNNLKKRSLYLDQKAYQGLHYTAPGTDLRIALPKGHTWKSAGFTTRSGIPFTANIPTEEVFTLPDKRFTEGTVRATRPLAYSANIINNFSLTFKEGKVVDFSAEQGEQVLENLLKVDEGSSLLGEVALVPNSSPISQSGLMFFNTLLDENASCHLALGNAYRFSLNGGEELTSDEFDARGGNNSLTHEDFMIGSGEMNIDGILPDGKMEPVMQDGEWAFLL
ncbi:MAG: aminopeptidase [Anaerolineales bacterium]